ncbi:hypothetical protein ACFQ7J_01870 [Streptomyces sp. NPDC056501]
MPPTSGYRWDTWPWKLNSPEPEQLVSGTVLQPLLRRALALTAPQS